MTLKMAKDSFFCIGNASACGNGFDIRISYVFSDGEKRDASLAPLFSGEKKHGPAELETVRYIDDILWISCKDIKNGKQIADISIELCGSEGTVESLGLIYGTGVFDLQSRQPVSDWQQGYLRHELISIHVGEDECEIVLSMRDPPADEVPGGETGAVPEEMYSFTVNDLKAMIKTDRNVLSYYSGEDKTSAEQLLEGAASELDGGNSGEALAKITEAERLIVSCLDKAMADATRYRNDL